MKGDSKGIRRLVRKRRKYANIFGCRLRVLVLAIFLRLKLFFFLLKIWTSRGAAILVYSSPRKKTKKLAKDTSATHTGLARDVTDTDCQLTQIKKKKKKKNATSTAVFSGLSNVDFEPTNRLKTAVSVFSVPLPSIGLGVHFRLLVPFNFLHIWAKVLFEVISARYNTLPCNFFFLQSLTLVLTVHNDNS